VRGPPARGAPVRGPTARGAPVRGPAERAAPNRGAPVRGPAPLGAPVRAPPTREAPLEKLLRDELLGLSDRAPSPCRDMPGARDMPEARDVPGAPGAPPSLGRPEAALGRPPADLGPPETPGRPDDLDAAVELRDVEPRPDPDLPPAPAAAPLLVEVELRSPVFSRLFGSCGERGLTLPHLRSSSSRAVRPPGRRSPPPSRVHRALRHASP
jgi:hypothetical protein